MSQLLPDKAIQIRQGEELDLVNLESFLTDKIDGFEKILEIRQFPGGFSNLTYLIVTNNKEYVLRRAPKGANIKSAHDMSREYKVLSTLIKYYEPLPQVTVYCDDVNIIGAPFYMMEKVDGIILRAKNTKKYNFEPHKWKQLSEILIDNLARLHQIEINESGLVNLGKPEGYVERQVDGWILRYEKSKTDQIEQMESIAKWMLNNKPRPQKPTFIHNDYKYDNVVFDIDLNQIKAVLDWEMATIGDPLMDLGATLAYWCEKDTGEFLKNMNITWFEGNLTRKEVVARYASKTGVDVTDILFYYVFGLYKNAVIIQQIYTRWKAGVTKDPRFETLIFGVKELANLAENAISNKTI